MFGPENCQAFDVDSCRLYGSIANLVAFNKSASDAERTTLHLHHKLDVESLAGKIKGGRFYLNED